MTHIDIWVWSFAQKSFAWKRALFFGRQQCCFLSCACTNYRLFSSVSQRVTRNFVSFNKMNTRYRGRRSNPVTRPNQQQGKFRLVIVEVNIIFIDYFVIIKLLNEYIFFIYRQLQTMKCLCVRLVLIESINFNTTMLPLHLNPTMKV